MAGLSGFQALDIPDPIFEFPRRRIHGKGLPELIEFLAAGKSGDQLPMILGFFT